MAIDFVKISLDVNDKVFLVTGGAAGVGAGVVRALLNKNARHVAFLDIAEREGAAFEKELTDHFGGLRAKFIKCDVSDEEQLSSAYNQILDKYKRLDGVINNAAVLGVTEHSVKKMVDVNFSGTVHGTMKAIDAMSVEKGGQGGIIVNISSLLALHPSTHFPVYAATKTAVLQFSIAMGAPNFYEKSKVRVLTVCLGPTDTAILHRTSSGNFNAIAQVASRTTMRQKVESVSKGIIEVIDKGKSGSTWIIKDDKPAYEFTEKISEAFQILSET